jgi:hypothetical protein
MVQSPTTKQTGTKLVMLLTEWLLLTMWCCRMPLMALVLSFKLQMTTQMFKRRCQLRNGLDASATKGGNLWINKVLACLFPCSTDGLRMNIEIVSHLQKHVSVQFMIRVARFDECSWKLRKYLAASLDLAWILPWEQVVRAVDLSKYNDSWSTKQQRMIQNGCSKKGWDYSRSATTLSSITFHV